MKQFSRRAFFGAGFGSLLLAATRKSPVIMTVNGIIPASRLGKSLIHEHILVDFVGADKYQPSRWNQEDVVMKMLPYLIDLKKYGVKSFFDCTPGFLGRDVSLLQMVSKHTGLQVITNTGYYGAGKNKYLPPWAFTESAEQLSDRWIGEFRHGIDGSSVKPGFIKIGVDNDGPLSELHKKLVKAAAITHLETGLTICSHTGKAAAAFEEIEILQTSGVRPDAFVWVHAQAETDKDLHTRAARFGTWVSLDGIGWGDFDNYADSIARLKSQGVLHRVLISHDAGWYKPDEPEAAVTGYTNVFKELIPRLQKKGFREEDFNQLLVRNPAKAFAIV